MVSATIADAWAQDFVRDAVRTCIATDYLPTIALPHGFDVDAYLDSLSHRWANAALGHRTSQVGTDGSVKLLQRIPEPALMALRDGRVPHLLALTVAGWIATVAPPPGSIRAATPPRSANPPGTDSRRQHAVRPGRANTQWRCCTTDFCPTT